MKSLWICLLFLHCCQVGLADIGPVCACPDVLTPVCGVDRRTYDSPCEAECHNVAYTNGPCPAGPPSPPQRTRQDMAEMGPVCECPMMMRPVCGEDRHTYDNFCLADCHGVDYINGACPPGPHGRFH